MDILLNSTFLVALTEMGDKTQLLAFVLATRFKKPWTIFFGILVATLLNHLMAASLGHYVALYIPAVVLKWVLALAFFAFAIWVLIPDEEGSVQDDNRWGAFLTTVISFFIAEMGDKTQLSTVALAAKYHSPYLVTLGTTIGMMLTNGLAVFFGTKMLKVVPLKWIHISAAILYVFFGVYILFGGTF